MMNNKKLVRLGAIVLVVAVAAAAWWYFGAREETDASRLVLYGNVDIREIYLTFNNAEHIERILVQEGDRVREGQLLATLHSARLQAEVDVAHARVAARKAALARLEAGSRQEEIAQARANVVAARARLNEAQATFERIQSLFKSSSVSRQQLDEAQARLSTRRADLKVAEETLTLAVTGPRAEDIDEARAMLQADEARLALSRELLQDTKLHAPADGVVRNRILEPGDMASPQTPVLTLALTDPVWVRAYAPETVLGQLTPGMPAEVASDSYPDKTYRGWIGFVSPTAEFTPKNVETPELRTRLVYQVRVYVCNPQDELRLGMPATVSIPLDQPKPDAGDTVSDCPEPDAA
nr:efflux RND transporter periplasmic adaptor subunit [Gammaproteobacteria bacterium]